MLDESWIICYGPEISPHENEIVLCFPVVENVLKDIANRFF